MPVRFPFVSQPEQEVKVCQSDLKPITAAAKIESLWPSLHSYHIVPWKDRLLHFPWVAPLGARGLKSRKASQSVQVESVRYRERSCMAATTF